jgi:hypothetical protein
MRKDFFALVEETYLLQKSSLVDIAASVKRSTQSDVPAAPAAESSVSRTSLPRIQLPQFSGCYEDWSAFRDLFQSLIDKDGSLSEVEKLHYLKVSLKAEADVVIKNLPTTVENYKRAWALLREQFENKRLLVRSCLSKFTSLSKMKSESAHKLRKIANCATVTVGTLESIE